MRKLTLALAAALGLFAVSSAQAAITLDLSANVGSDIQFVGTGSATTITLTPGIGGVFTTNNFLITGSTGSVGDALGVYGNLTGPGFTYNASDIVVSGSTETAILGGSGNVLSLGPAGGDTLTADVVGVNIQTSGTGGTVDFTGTVNLSNISYSGTNSDLLQLKNEASAPGNGGILALTFQFIPGKSLTELLGPGTSSTSYSGTLTVVPEPGTIAMALSGVIMLGGLGYLRRRTLA